MSSSDEESTGFTNPFPVMALTQPNLKKEKNRQKSMIKKMKNKNQALKPQYVMGRVRRFLKLVQPYRAKVIKELMLFRLRSRGLIMFRMLLSPLDLSSIENNREDLQRRTPGVTINILDGNSTDRVVLIYGDQFLATKECLLNVFEQLVTPVPDRAKCHVVCMRLLLPCRQARFFLKRKGAALKEIQQVYKTCTFVILDSGDLPPEAFPNDIVLEIYGRRGEVSQAIQIIADCLDDYFFGTNVVKGVGKQKLPRKAPVTRVSVPSFSFPPYYLEPTKPGTPRPSRYGDYYSSV